MARLGELPWSTPVGCRIGFAIENGRHQVSDQSSYGYGRPACRSDNGLGKVKQPAYWILAATLHFLTECVVCKAWRNDLLRYMLRNAAKKDDADVLLKIICTAGAVQQFFEYFGCILHDALLGIISHHVPSQWIDKRPMDQCTSNVCICIGARHGPVSQLFPAKASHAE